MGKKTTMTDIARALGVSQTLVSFVLSGKNDMGISADTKKKVLQTAEKMGYCNGTTSKMLKLGRCGYMAVVFANKPSDALSDILSGVCDGLSEFGYKAVVANPVKGADIDECLETARDKKADGFIIFGKNDRLESELSASGAVFVCLEEAEYDKARKCAVKLCESVLACADDVKRKSASKKKQPSDGTKRKAGKAKSHDKENSADSAASEVNVEKKTELIWLL